MKSIRENRNGFSLIELLIAMTILAIGIAGVAGLAGTAVKSSSNSQALTQAVNMAQSRMEGLLSVDYDNIQLTDTSLSTRADLRRTCAGASPNYTCTPETPTLNLNTAEIQKVFTWQYTVKLIDLDGVGGATQSDGLKRIDVTVSWTDPLWKSTRSVTLTTMRSRG